MDGLRGRAEQIRVTSSTWVQGGGTNGNSSVSGGTDHICTFQIGLKTIRITSPAPPVIESGDEVVVIGKSAGDGIFHANYYSNLSRGVQHSRGSAARAMVFGVAMVAASIGIAFAIPSIGAWIFVMALIVGFPMCCYEAYARSATSRLLQQLSEPSNGMAQPDAPAAPHASAPLRREVG